MAVSLGAGSAGPGSVPLHNAHVYVCAAGDAEEPQQFDGDALRQLHGAAAVHAGSSWTFGVSQCECGPGCEPGDWLVYPHYLHLRPAAPDAAPPRRSADPWRPLGRELHRGRG